MTGWRTFRTAEAEFKRDVLERLRRARSEGVSTGKIVEVCGDEIGIHTIYDMLEAKGFPRRIWELVDEGLKELGY